MTGIQKVIGLMSGTSLDGVDASLIETDGEAIVRPGPGLTLGYDAKARAELRAALLAAQDLASAGHPPQVAPRTIGQAERHLTQAHADAVKALLKQTGLAAEEVALLGFHGQTILHRPERHWTWQIGDGALLARRTGIAVINDFRSADIQAGGQGAPLMPLYHAALARQAGLPEPLVVANIGGVAQVTYIKKDLILAFDTGPGNAPIDDWMMRHSGRPLDPGGALAAKGTVNKPALEQMLADPWFQRPAPKSLDRMDFGIASVSALSPADGAATLVAFTAAALAQARAHFPQAPASWIVSGGGRHNATLMAMLKARIEGPVMTAEDVGWDGDGLEAQGFAYLAMRAQKGLPLSLPTTTGVARAVSGGRYHPKPDQALAKPL